MLSVSCRGIQRNPVSFLVFLYSTRLRTREDSALSAFLAYYEISNVQTGLQMTKWALRSHHQALRIWSILVLCLGVWCSFLAQPTWEKASYQFSLLESQQYSSLTLAVPSSKSDQYLGVQCEREIILFWVIQFPGLLSHEWGWFYEGAHLLAL